MFKYTNQNGRRALKINSKILKRLKVCGRNQIFKTVPYRMDTCFFLHIAQDIKLEPSKK